MAAKSLKRNLRDCHRLLDSSSDLPDIKYIQLVCLINELRRELFSALAMIGVEIPMTEREVQPGGGEVETKKRDWAMHQKPQGNSAVAPPVTPTENPFARNGW